MLVVLVGMGALVIDIGALYVERRELQNGADAAALAVAQDCVEGDCGSGGGAAQAQKYANLNANDGVSALDPSTPCGVGPGLAACSARRPERSIGRERLGACRHQHGRSRRRQRGVVPPGARHQLAHRQDRHRERQPPPGGRWAVAPSCHSSSPSASGGNGREHCDRHTSDRARRPITFHGTNPTSVGCPIDRTLGPRSARWLRSVVAANCRGDLAAGQWADVDTGANLAADCDVKSWQNQEVVIAIFDQTNGETGANGAYRSPGSSASRSSAIASSPLEVAVGSRSSARACRKPERPVPLRRVHQVSTDGGDFGTGPDFGARVIKMVG